MVDYSAEIENIKNYYADLLILQYRQKPKARTMIKMGVDLYLADGCVLQLQDVLNIDTAIGAQLDLIGKLLDCPRDVQGVVNSLKFFTFHVDENSLGFSRVGEPANGGNFRTIRNYNQSLYTLPDEDYRFLLRFKSAINVMRGSIAGVDEALYTAFEGDVIIKNMQNLQVLYIISNAHSLAPLAAKSLGYYRTPEGIGSDYVLKVANPSAIFGFNIGKNGIINRTVAGFSNKNKTREGTFLTKDNLISLITV